ncbi:MAG: hypothetical protein KGI98_11075 [Euryarchaeota archaeon]|nr:hypothetical protein [Euryarchaeota archaeon]
MRVGLRVPLTGVLFLLLLLPTSPVAPVHPSAMRADPPVRASQNPGDLLGAPAAPAISESPASPWVGGTASRGTLPIPRWTPLPSYIWMVQLQFYNISGTPYAQSDFDRIAANGYNTVELIVPWTLETSQGVYDFSQLDTYMGEAQQDGLAVVLVFWYEGWTFGVANWVPSWITARETYSNGATASYPPWWDAGARSDYFGFLNATIAHVDPDGNFQGVYAPFGWLDYPWSPPPSGASGAVVAGYSAATTAAYDWYLESQWASLAQYNSAYGTSYTAWSQIPASLPGSAEWNDFGNFRIFSVEQTFAQLSQYVRAVTNRTIFYYYGGDISGAVVGVNLEDYYFQLAAQYGGIVNVDDADWPALVATFGSLASRYHVPFIQEFTPPSSGFQGGFEETMANMYIGRPWEVGADFFTYNPPNPSFAWAFPLFGSLRSITEATAPSQTPQNGVAALVSYFSGFYTFANNGQATNSLPTQQNFLFQLTYTHRPFEVVSDLELMASAVNLTQFSSVLDLGSAYGDTAHAPYIQGDLRWFVGHGGNLVASSSSVAFLNGQPALVQLSLSPAPAADQIEVQGTSVPSSSVLYLAACNWDIDTNSATAESGSLGVVLSTWGLPGSGTYYVNDLLSGTTTSVTASSGVVSIPWSPAAGQLNYFQLVPATPLILTIATNASQGEGSLPVALSAAVSGGTTIYGAVSWTLGDDATATGSSITHTYVAPSGSVFTVNATVADSSASTVTSTLQITVLLSLSISLSPAFAWAEVGGSRVGLQATSRGGDGPINLTWSDNGSTLPGAFGWNLSYAPTIAGNRTLSVRALDALGGRAVAAVPIEVLPPLAVALTGPSVVELPAGASFLAHLSGGRPGSAVLSWWVGGTRVAGANGTLLSLPSSSFPSLRAGNYVINATALDALGGRANSAPSSLVVVAHVAVRINPSNANVTLGSSAHLTSTTVGGTCPCRYVWFETSPVQLTGGRGMNQTENATSTGTFTFEVKVMDNLGGAAFANATIVVLAPPSSPPPNSPAPNPGGGWFSMLGSNTLWVFLVLLLAVGGVLGALELRRRRRGGSAQAAPPAQEGGKAPMVEPSGWSEDPSGADEVLPGPPPP